MYVSREGNIEVKHEHTKMKRKLINFNKIKKINFKIKGLKISRFTDQKQKTKINKYDK